MANQRPSRKSAAMAQDVDKSEFKENAANRPNGDAVMYLNRPRLCVKINGEEKFLDLNSLEDGVQKIVCAINAENQSKGQQMLIKKAQHGQEITIKFTVSIPQTDKDVDEDDLWNAAEL